MTTQTSRPPSTGPRPGGPPGSRPSGPPGSRPGGFSGPRPGGGPGGSRPGGSGGRPGGGRPGGRPGGRFGGRRGRPRYYSRRKICGFCVDHIEFIDYKDTDRFRRYMTDRWKIESRRKTGVCSKHQRALATAIKRARHLALIPFSPDHDGPSMRWSR
jgi:small subunit ribosomal protein S18